MVTLELGNVRSRSASLPLIGAMFFFSGFATLIYQVAWQRLLTVYYGVGPVSIAIIVSVFLLGLGVGGLLGGWVAERARKLALMYGLIEGGLGVYGLSSLPFLDFLGRATAGGSYGLSGLCSAAFLLPPTILMGMTLPIILKLYNRRAGRYLQSLSFLYFINTLGAALGSLVAAYILISFFDLSGAIYTAVFLNLALVCCAFLFLKSDNFEARSAPMLVPSGDLLGQVALLFVFVTGFVAIGYEIAWTLAMSNILKASPYTFATVLFVYLIGIAIGSYGMKRISESLAAAEARSLFFLLQILIAVTASFPLIIFNRVFINGTSALAKLYTFTESAGVHPPVFDPTLPWAEFFSHPSKWFIAVDIFSGRSFSCWSRRS